jgi:hemolysin D
MAHPAELVSLVRERLSRVDVRSDKEFLPPAEEITATPPSPVRIAFLAAICALFAIALLVSWIGEIDIYAVADGKIQPSGRSKVVQPTDTGRIRKIFVQNGMSVHAGDILVLLDSTEAAADHKNAAQQVDALTAEILRRKAAIEAAQSGRFRAMPAIAFPAGLDRAVRDREQTILAADLAKLQSDIDVSRSKISEDVEKRRTLAATIAADHDVAATQTERVKIRNDLAQQGWESRSNVIDAQEELEKENASLASERGQFDELNAEIGTLKRQIDDTVAQFVSDNAQHLADAEEKQDEHTQELVKAADKFVHTKLTAPIDGTVQELGVTTVGQVVSAGQQLMTIVPRRDRLEVEALVKNADIGFIKPGARVVIKVQSFPFTRYGTLKGAVRSISRDAVDMGQAEKSGDTQQTPVSPQDSASAPTPQMANLVYPVMIELDHATIFADGRDVPLSPGMSVQAEIRTGERRVIDYILSPLKEVTSEAAHER